MAVFAVSLECVTAGSSIACIGSDYQQQIALHFFLNCHHHQRQHHHHLVVAVVVIVVAVVVVVAAAVVVVVFVVVSVVIIIILLLFCCCFVAAAGVAAATATAAASGCQWLPTKRISSRNDLKKACKTMIFALLLMLHLQEPQNSLHRQQQLQKKLRQ